MPIELLTLRIPPALKRLLVDDATETGQSINSRAREILEQWYSPCDSELLLRAKERKLLKGSRAMETLHEPDN